MAKQLQIEQCPQTGSVKKNVEIPNNVSKNVSSAIINFIFLT